MYHNAKTTNDNNEITVALAELVESLTPFAISFWPVRLVAQELQRSRRPFWRRAWAPGSPWPERAWRPL